MYFGFAPTDLTCFTKKITTNDDRNSTQQQQQIVCVFFDRPLSIPRMHLLTVCFFLLDISYTHCLWLYFFPFRWLICCLCFSFGFDFKINFVFTVARINSYRLLFDVCVCLYVYNCCFNFNKNLRCVICVLYYH